MVDIDGDNDLDLLRNQLVGSETKHYWHEKIGEPAIFQSKELINIPGNDLSYSTMAYIDDDNIPDFVSLAEDRTKLQYNKGTGTGYFGLPQVIEEADFTSLGMYVMDLNQDGLDEMLMYKSSFGSGGGNNDVSWYQAPNGDGVFEERKHLEPGGTKPNILEIGDINNDQIDDFVVGYWEGLQKVIWYQNTNGNPDFTRGKTLHSGYGFLTSLKLIDLDGDGDLDILFSLHSTQFLWLENLDGHGNFAPAQAFFDDSPGGFGSVFLEAIDIDMDNDKDIVFHHYGATQEHGIRWIENENNTYTEVHFVNSVSFTATTDVEAIDFDQDGDIDLIISSLDEGLFWYQNDSNGNFSDKIQISDAHPKGFQPIDIDGDNDLDLLLFGSYWYLSYLENSGDLIFNDSVFITDQLDKSTFSVFSDIDGDGLKDLVILPGGVGGPSEFHIFRSLGNGDFHPHFTVDFDFATSPVQHKGLLLHDLDHDGAEDIFVISDDLIRHFKNPFGVTNIRGVVFMDQNENGLFEANELPFNGLQVDLSPDGISTWSTGIGQYFFNVEDGSDYDLGCETPFIWSFTTPSEYQISTQGPGSFEERNFGIIPFGEIYIAALDLSMAIAPCDQVVPLWVSYQNAGNQTASARISLIIDPSVEVINPELPPDEINGNEYIWWINDIPATVSGVIKVPILTPQIAPTIPLEFSCSIELYDQNGTVQYQTQDTHTEPVICSYDPNDKLVDPSFPNGPDYFQIEDTLIYTIRFQNTGDYPASNVRIEDQLDPQLNLETFEIISGSHHFETTLTDEGALAFYFPNINLPDTSISYLESQGFIKYSIQANNNLELGAQVDNNAAIFFDFNLPVITNTVTSVLGEPSSIQVSQIGDRFSFTTYPNPITNELNILFDNPLREASILKVYDYKGSLIKSFQVSENLKEFKIHFTGLANGIYLIQFLNNEFSRSVMVSKEE